VRRLAWTLLASFALSAAATAGTLLPPDPARTVGTRVPFDGFADEHGRPLSALVTPADLRRDPRPWIVSPMYTRCPNTCSALTTGLRRALERSGLSPSEYRIVSFSFDPAETDEGLRGFRAHMHLPASWLTLRAGDPRSLERTLRSLDFRTISTADGDFAHPNLVAVLAPDRRLAGYLFGVEFSPSALAAAVRRARNGVSPVDAWRPYLLFFAAVGFVGSAAVFGVLLLRRTGARAASRAAGRPRPSGAGEPARSARRPD
jgi:cytochrome oxidase Cu insertion factor (SCO1/SenC/PrrC family)